jgi:hypothetical protein
MTDNAPQWPSWVVMPVTGLMLGGVVVAAIVVSITRGDIASIAAVIR